MRGNAMNLNPWSRGARRAFPTLRTLLAAGMVLTTFSAMAADTGDKPRRPNVVVFLVDDMGWRDSAVYGSRYYETPEVATSSVTATTGTRSTATARRVRRGSIVSFRGLAVRGTNRLETGDWRLE